MIYTVAAVAMLVLWAVGTFVFDAPGWIHGLLTIGIAMLIWSVVRASEKRKD